MELAGDPSCAAAAAAAVSVRGACSPRKDRKVRMGDDERGRGEVLSRVARAGSSASFVTGCSAPNEERGSWAG
jgi:hypothetical protein